MQKVRGIKALTNYLALRGYDVSKGDEQDPDFKRKVEIAKVRRNRLKKLVATCGLIAYVGGIGAIGIIQNGEQTGQQVVTIKSSAPSGGYNAIGISASGTTYQCRFMYSCTGLGRSVTTGEVVGYVKIGSMKVSEDLTQGGSGLIEGQHMASIQLNAYVELTNNSNNGSTTYNYIWAQNVAEFNTSNSMLRFSDDIFPGYAYFSNVYGNTKSATPMAITPETVTGYGTSSQGIYQYDTPSYRYGDGVQIYLTIKTGEVAGYPVLEFGYATVDKGGRVSSGIYDIVRVAQFINPSSSTSLPQIAVGYGSSLPSNAKQNRTDLVLGGPYGSEVAAFSSLNANLGLYFQSNNGLFYPLDVVYKTSKDTNEGASNINTTLPRSGYAKVTIGKLVTGSPSEVNFPIAELLRSYNQDSGF